MFYSCRAFPVSGNNGGHGSPLPAPWPFSVVLENRARTPGGTCRFGGKYVSRPLARSVARVQRSAPKNPNWNFAARGKRVQPLASGEFLDAKYTLRLDFARLRLTIARRRHVSEARLGFFREYLDRHRPKRLNRSLCNGSQPEPACCTNIRARAVNGTKTVYRFWVGCIALRGRCLKSVSIRKAGKRIHMRLEMCSLRTRAVVKRGVTKSVNLFTRSRHHYAGHFSFHRPFLSD